MSFNDPSKPKTLRTKLSVETLSKFKALAAQKQISMADYLEELIQKEIDKNK